MARIIEIIEEIVESKKKSKISSNTKAIYSEFFCGDEKHVAIKTIGSSNRKNKDAQSQNIQLDKNIAQQLVALLQKTFKL